ncbi:SpoIIE family protein phosphatase [Actinacidiphila glaucinigra]|uniref:SpoIIE family protein phosphatase n=1 Tax=Actinacidiphila glaucinigra TaxID=235986 RepID=UPI0035DBFFE0
MSDTDRYTTGPERLEGLSTSPSGLMDLLGVAAVLLEGDGRVDMWSPQAEELFGYTAEEAVGRYAAHLLVHDAHRKLVVRLFAEVMRTGESWAGSFPVRCKDGSRRLVEFRNMRLMDSLGDHYILGLATDRTTMREVEQEVALSTRLISQSPIGIAVLDTGLRYLSLNPALARFHGISVQDHVGNTFRSVLPGPEFRAVEAEMRQVLASGVPMLDRYIVGRTPAGPRDEHAWAVSLYRLEDHRGHVLGIAEVVVDITDRHRAAAEADRARRRLAMIADGSARIGTALEVERTVRELVEVVVPELADLAVVDILDAVLDQRAPAPARGAPVFRSLAVRSAYPTDAARAVPTPGDVVTYHAEHLSALCVRTLRPHMIARAGRHDLERISPDPESARLLVDAGVHSCMAIPLIARGEVLGVLGMCRARTRTSFDEDDLTLACELAARAAVCIDNARWYQQVSNTAETLQRSLLPQPQPHHPGLEVAARYRPAQARSKVGGDWYDVIPLDDERTALVVGDVMGSGMEAATTMGRLRTATSTLAELDLDPAQVLAHLDKITRGLDPYIATCVYALYDARSAECRLATAGHLPPVLVHGDGSPELLDLPTGTPLGVGGVPFESASITLVPGDRLVLYTDGLVETRDDPIDERLALLLALLGAPDPSVEETCDRLLRELPGADGHDDVALLIARADPHRRSWESP